MKKILFFLIAFCACVTIQAQKVDVVVKLLTSPNRLGIYATATAFGPTAFGPNNLSGLTPTIKWSTGCGDVSLGTFTNTTSLVLAKQTTGTNGGFNYATIDGNALSAVVLVNGEETLLGTIPIVVVGAASPCDFLASVIHNHPNANDGNFFAESLGTFDITGPSTYTSLAINVVLPVDLVTFKGIKKGKVSQLQWEATGEKNLVNYIVERSTDGRNFTKFSGNPVVKQITGGNRDPKVIWHAPTKKTSSADFVILLENVSNWANLIESRTLIE